MTSNKPRIALGAYTGMLILTFVLVGAVLLPFVCGLSADCRLSPPDTSTPLASGVQLASEGNPWGLADHCVRVYGAALDRECVESALTAGVTVCRFEDGNPSGLPCLWVDPDSTDIYYVDSSEYHD